MTTPTPQNYGHPEAERLVLHPGPNGEVGIVAAVCNVMADLPNIGKDDQAPAGEGRYRYRGIEAITRHVQQLLARHEVLIVPAAEVLATVPSPAMNEGWQDVIMRVEWTLLHTDGSSVTAVTNGVGRDKSDKGANKAQTQAYKYLLLHVLCVADGKDDSDGQSYEDGRSGQPQPVERFTAPDGTLIEVWPGEVAAKAAKAEVVAALGGDKDAAAKAWTAAGFDGKFKVRRDELAPMLALLSGGEIGAGAEPDTTGMPQDAGDARPATSPGVQPGPKAAEAPAPTETIDARAISQRANSLFEAAIGDGYPARKKSWVNEQLRHALVYLATNGERTSSSQLTDGNDFAAVWRLLDALEAGKLTFEFSADPAKGVEWRWHDGSTNSVLWTELNLAEAGVS